MVTDTPKEVERLVDCEKCGKPILLEQGCFQVRYGAWEDHGYGPDFEAEEDVAYFCEDCGVEHRKG